MPFDVKLGCAQPTVMPHAEARDEGLDAAAGQAAGEVGYELAGAMCEFRAVDKARDP